MNPNDALFKYKATVIRVIDGDTIETKIDLGFKVQITEKLRLYGIDAPEVRGSEKLKGQAAASHLIKLICSHAANLVDGKLPTDSLAVIYVATRKDKTGKYGRYLANLWGVDQEGLTVDLNQKMVDDGHAIERTS